MSGARGRDRLVHVPVGTAVLRRTYIDEEASDDGRDAMAGEEGFDDGEDGEDEFPEQPRRRRYVDEEVTELISAGQTFVAARGGRGGRGNALNGREGATAGAPGEEGEFVLELRLMADIGLIGMPNVGKSSLLRAMTNATPKVADYSFSTRQPQLGRLRPPPTGRGGPLARATGNPFLSKALQSRFAPVIVADLPGLIAGASAGRGLGHRFLRHAYHCRLFVIVLDASGGLGDTRSLRGEAPLEQLAALQSELALYRQQAGGRAGAGGETPTIVVANKVDVDGARSNVDALVAGAALPVHAVSATTGEGVDRLVAALYGYAGSSAAPRSAST